MHYIELREKILSDGLDRLQQRFQQNSDAMKQIAENGTKFAEEYFNPNVLLRYMGTFLSYYAQICPEIS